MKKVTAGLIGTLLDHHAQQQRRRSSIGIQSGPGRKWIRVLYL